MISKSEINQTIIMETLVQKPHPNKNKKS